MMAGTRSSAAAAAGLTLLLGLVTGSEGSNPVSNIVGKCRLLGCKGFMKYEGPMYLFVLIWMIINVILFVTTFYKYRGDKWTWIRLVVGDGLPVARGAAQVLNFNCALILLPVCRNVVDWSKRSIRRLFDKNLVFHKYCAYTICFFASVHILAHFYNINNMVTEDRYVSEAERIVGNEDNAENVAFTTWPGITGLVITFALILIVTTAVETIRRSYFELFWYTHHLFVVFFIALMIHGNSGFIKFQENFKYVPYTDDGKCIALTTTTQIVPTDNYRNIRPTTCVVPSDFDGNETYRVDGFVCGKNVPPPLFCYNINGNPGFPDTPAFNELPCCNCLRCSQAITPNGGPATWYWVILPFFIYLCERLFRLYKSQCRKLKVLKIIRHNDSTPVMEVQIQKVKTKAGQYAFLHCPSVSCTEWHPFTLTSCPEDEYISFHIRLVGDWTCALAERCGFYSDVPLNIAQLPNVAIDGPFGTSSEDIFRYETGVCVCAGIGVTPFASLLKELFYRKFTTGAPALKCKTVYFYWICPGFDSWSWFSNLLVEFESQCHEANDPDFLQIRIHMSRGWSKDDAEKLYLQDSEEGDSVVKDDRGRRLKAKMNFGRPNWDVEFSKMKVVHSGTVGVFFCGPKVLPPKETLACAPSDSLFTNIGPSPGKYLNPFLVRA